MNIASTINAMQQGLTAVQAFTPFLALGGPAAAGVGKIAESVAEIGQAVLENIEAGLIVATSDDADAIKAILGDVQAENDRLAARIAAG
jgi:hypothetical protein